MNYRFLKLVRVACLLWLVAWAAASHVLAETPLRLGIKWLGGQAQLSVTGTAGTVCQLQWTDSVSATSRWYSLGHLRLSSSPAFFTDAASSSIGRRSYRAVWVPNTNLVWISPGTFTMGSPATEALRFPDETQHTVTISRGFWLCQSLVTQGEYQAVTGSNPSYFVPSSGYPADLTRPVEQVRWIDATNYCGLRTQQERSVGLIPANYAYRLPTEAEWEYACRAGTTTAFYLGSSLHSGQANFDGQLEYDSVLGQISNANGSFANKTTSVGSYGANAWGLYDMIANVWEWTADWYDSYPTGSVTDPQGPASGTERVIRGGSYYSAAQHCRAARRNTGEPTFGNYGGIGFRVVLAPAP
jgi:sulfatase modifying factor 1